MLYLLHMGNHADLTYRGGQEPIIHLEADLYDTVTWADNHNVRWAFTLSNAGAAYFEDRADLAQLHEVDWTAVKATYWTGHKEGKQAEFLVQTQFPWQLVSRIGVESASTRAKVLSALSTAINQVPVSIQPDWYY